LKYNYLRTVDQSDIRGNLTVLTRHENDPIDIGQISKCERTKRVLLDHGLSDISASGVQGKFDWKCN